MTGFLEGFDAPHLTKEERHKYEMQAHSIASKLDDVDTLDNALQILRDLIAVLSEANELNKSRGS